MQDRDIYLLDDVLASVDSHVAAWLTRHALLGPLLSGKTVLVSTHSRALLAAAHLVVTVERGGRLVAAAQQAAVEGVGAGQGPAKEQERGGCEGSDEAASEGGREGEGERESEGESSGSSREVEIGSVAGIQGEEQVGGEPPGNDETGAEHDAERCRAAKQEYGGEDREERAVGHVRPRVYLAYMAASGWGWVAVILTSLVLMQVHAPQ